jgi:spermidine/putrescine transport system ATP-binding protein
MQLELKAIQHDIGITFVHVTHDQEEAMTMADVIAVMNHGRIEQLGTPAELYETPRTAFVAGFLGASNLIPGAVVGPDRVRLRNGPEVRVPPEALAGRVGDVAVGIRPEKIELGDHHENRLEGRVVESAYVGVATQFLVDTACGRLAVYSQNSRPGSGASARDDAATLSWSPEATFVVDSTEEGRE